MSLLVWPHDSVKCLIARHSFHHPWPHTIQIGPNWDLSEALNNRYRLPAPPASSAPGHFGVLLIKMHLLAFVVVAIKWIIRPKTKKNLFSWSLHLNEARNSSAMWLSKPSHKTLSSQRRLQFPPRVPCWEWSLPAPPPVPSPPIPSPALLHAAARSQGTPVRAAHEPEGFLGLR